MNIFDEALAELSNDAHFDETGTFQCTLKSSEDTKNNERPLLLTVYQDINNMMLKLALTLQKEIPDTISSSFFSDFSKSSMEPFRADSSTQIFLAELNFS